MFVYCEEMFASSWVGKPNSGWGWTFKNEALEEVVRCLMDREGECVSGSIAFICGGPFTGRQKPYVPECTTAAGGPSPRLSSDVGKGGPG